MNSTHIIADHGKKKATADHGKKNQFSSALQLATVPTVWSQWLKSNCLLKKIGKIEKENDVVSFEKSSVKYLKASLTEYAKVNCLVVKHYCVSITKKIIFTTENILINSQKKVLSMILFK